MNDTTQTNTPEPNPPLKALPHELLIAQVLTAFDSYIVRVVDARVNAIFEAHATMKQLDDQWEQRIKGYVSEMLDDHEGEYNHVDRDEIDDRIGTYIAHHDFSDQIKRSVEEILSDGDYVTEDRVVDIVTDEIDFEEKVKEVLRNL